MASRPIRVLYLDHTAKLSGGELALARLLGALDRRRVEPVVVLAEEGPLAELLSRAAIETHVLPLSTEVRGVRKDSLGFTGILGQLRSLHIIWRYARRVSELARQYGADLIYTNSLKSDIYGALAARLAGLPIIWHIRDGIDPGYLPRPAVWLIRLLARRVPTWVVANSASTLGSLRLDGSDRTAVIASGLSREYIERCQAPRSPGSIAHIGMIGRIAPWKGQDVFLQAAALLLDSGHLARFCIAGAPMFGEKEQRFEEQLHQLAASLGIGHHVEFLGFRETPDVLRSLDVLVHASRIPEPFGQVIVEGLAAGLAVVATNAGGAREIIDNGRTGLLIPMGSAQALAQALAQLLSRPGYARQLGDAGREHVLKHFTAEKSARESEALYEHVVRGSTRATHGRHGAVIDRRLR